jgi:hypothetical protein
VTAEHRISNVGPCGQATWLTTGVFASLLLCGCSRGPGAIPPVVIDVDEVTEAIIEHHDKDGNGTLSLEELKSVAAIGNRIAKYDGNADRQVDKGEISANLQRIFDGRMGLLSATCRVTRNGKPLSGAIVYFVPLPELDEVLPVAGAVTTSTGVGDVSILPSEELPKNTPKVRSVVRPGLYFVEVKHPSIKIPEQYNTKTILGAEVMPETVSGGPITFDLKF